MPTPRELLNISEWPNLPYDDALITEVICPFCAAIIPLSLKEIHKTYHIKLLDRLDRMDRLILGEANG